MFGKSRKKRRRATGPVSHKKEIIKILILTIIIAAALRLMIVYPFRVDDKSMQGALYQGDFLLASKLSYNWSSPALGDIIIFKHPFRSGENAVGRVIALEGQSVEIIGKNVYVDGEISFENSTVTHSDYRILPQEFSNRDYTRKVHVPSGHVYVLGDNRDESEDSRNFGFVSKQNIVGKGLFVYFSWEPDPNAPSMESPYIIPAIQIIFYNMIHFADRIRWDRLFSST